MTLTLHQADPKDPAATRLLQASHALMKDLFPAESCHFLDIEDLCTPEIEFFVVKDGSITIGCGALSTQPGYGELKSMFVDPAARGKGAANLLLTHLTELARSKNLPLLRLETGEKLTAAINLYQRHGFTRRPPFGTYPDHPDSTFMERQL